MGHLINPISLRLGYSRNWGFSGALMESKSQYFYLNTKYWNILLFFKRIFNLQTFEKMGVMFSHLRYVSSYKKEVIIIYLYDGPLQSESFIFYKYLNRFKKFKKLLRYKKLFFKKFLKRSFLIFYYLFNLNFFFNNINKYLLNLLSLKLLNLLNLINILKLNLKGLDNLYFLNNVSSKDRIHMNTLVSFFFKNKVNDLFFSFLIFDINANSFLSSVFINKHFNFSNFINVVNSFNKIFLSFKIFNFKNFVNIYSKFPVLKTSNLFLDFQINYKNIIEEYFYELNNIIYFKDYFNIFENKLIVNFSTDLVKDTFLQRNKYYKFLNKFIKILYFTKKRKFIFLNFFFKFFSYYSTNFFIFFKNIIKFFKKFLLNKDINIYFKNVSKFQITSSLISRYISIRLKQRFSLKEILKPILKDLSSNPSIEGFKISCCGRFTKKEIATYKWERQGKISLNTIKANIDYSLNHVILKYSVCGIKVWLHRNSNYKYFFKKWFEPYKFFNKQKKTSKKFYKNENIKNFKFMTKKSNFKKPTLKVLNKIKFFNKFYFNNFTNKDKKKKLLFHIIKPFFINLKY